jgi:hypothetical protein
MLVILINLEYFKKDFRLIILILLLFFLDLEKEQGLTHQIMTFNSYEYKCLLNSNNKRQIYKFEFK